MLKQLLTALSHSGVVGRPVSQTPHEWNVCGELRVKPNACTECGRCVGACPVTALTVTPVPEPLMVFYPGRCIGCARCVEHCAGKNLSFAASKGFMLEPNDEFIVVQRLRKPPTFPVPARKGIAQADSSSPSPVSPVGEVGS
jgi:ferredoxin